MRTFHVRGLQESFYGKTLSPDTPLSAGHGWVATEANRPLACGGERSAYRGVLDLVTGRARRESEIQLFLHFGPMLVQYSKLVFFIKVSNFSNIVRSICGGHSYFE